MAPPRSRLPALDSDEQAAEGFKDNSQQLVDLFRSQGGDGTGFSIRVHKLLDSSGRMKAGNFVYCGKLALTENYLDDIQAQFGGGNYRLHLTKDGRIVNGGVQQIMIAAAQRFNGQAPGQPQDGTTAPASAGPPYVYEPQPRHENPMKQMQQTLQVYKDIKAMFEPEPLKVQSQDMSLTQAMLTMIESDDQQMDRLRRRLFRDDGGGGTDWERIIDKGLAMLPVVMQGIQAMFGSRAPAPQQPPPQALPAQSLLTPALQRFYTSMLDSMAQKRDSNVVARELVAFSDDMQVRATLDHLTQEDVPIIIGELAKLEIYIHGLTTQQKSAMFTPGAAEWLEDVLVKIADILFPETPTPQQFTAPAQHDSNTNQHPE